MTFFYDLNKKLDAIREKPETTHKQLNERDEGKPGKMFSKIAKDAGDRYGSEAAGRRVAGAVRNKLRDQGKLEETDIEEGPEIFKLKADAAKQAGEKTFQGPDGKTYPVKEAARPDFPDIDKDGNRKESIKKAAADAAAMKEASQDNVFTAHKRPREETPKIGSVERGSKHDIEHTATGRKVTRRTDAQGMSVGTDDDEHKDAAPRGRGRPKGSKKSMGAKGPSGKSKLMTREEIDEAIAALEEAGYAVTERELEPKEKSEKERVFKKHMKPQMADFKKRYGERGENVAHAVATNIAKGVKMGKKSAKEDNVEETTVAGSVAPSVAAPKSKGKGGMTFGKGIYDSLNRDLEAMISESMNVSVNMSMDEHGEPRKNITVSAEGEAAEQLAQLLNLAGMAGQGSSHSDVCPVCGQADCGCEEMVDENAPDYPTNTAVIGADDPQMRRFAGGLDGPKGSGQTTGAPFNRQDSRQGAMSENKDLGMKLYAELKSFKG